jgi:hypothetical protein
LLDWTYANALSFLVKVWPLCSVVRDKNVKYKDGHCVLPDLQSYFKRGIFYMPEISGVCLVYGLISEMNVMCP